MKPYLYIEELAALTPWTAQAIRKKVQRGELRAGVHYFQENYRARLIFKWEAIVQLIEGQPGNHRTAAVRVTTSGRAKFWAREDLDPQERVTASFPMLLTTGRSSFSVAGATASTSFTSSCSGS